MIFIDNENNNNPKQNLALEEYIARNFKGDTDYLLFYINEPSIIIGSNQNTLEEINYNYVHEHGIHVVRRISGGGAVYHDYGNLNFSFITNHNADNFRNFKNFTKPVIQVLHQLGLNAELIGRNDILVNGKKISGTAQFSTGKRMISHGTLLFNTNLNEVANALHVKMNKIESKGHKSVRSRVANIADFMKEKMDIATFRKLILDGLSADDNHFSHYHLTEEEWKGVHQLKAEKYDTWDWNYGKSPKFNIQRSRRFPIGEIDIRLNVEKGMITELKIFGDFFNRQPIEELAQKLIGIRYEKEDIDRILAHVNFNDYFGEIKAEELGELIHGEDK